MIQSNPRLAGDSSSQPFSPLPAYVLTLITSITFTCSLVGYFFDNADDALLNSLGFHAWGCLPVMYGLHSFIGAWTSGSSNWVMSLLPGLLLVAWFALLYMLHRRRLSALVMTTAVVLSDFVIALLIATNLDLDPYGLEGFVISLSTYHGIVYAGVLVHLLVLGIMFHACYQALCHTRKVWTLSNEPAPQTPKQVPPPAKTGHAVVPSPPLASDDPGIIITAQTATAAVFDERTGMYVAASPVPDAAAPVPVAHQPAEQPAPQQRATYASPTPAAAEQATGPIEAMPSARSPASAEVATSAPGKRFGLVGILVLNAALVLVIIALDRLQTLNHASSPQEEHAQDTYVQEEGQPSHEAAKSDSKDDQTWTAGTRATQQGWVVDNNRPVSYTNSIGMKLMYIPAGEFTMGSPDSELERRPNEVQHRVRITRPFMMGSTEVTQGQWRAVMESNPSYFKGDNLPVEVVTWHDAVAFCETLSRKEGKTYRLPTEAEWEYACRAGTTTAFNWSSNSITSYQANYRLYMHKTAAVGSFAPNTWGLHDMHGNVWEWCSDWFDYYPSGRVTDPTGPTSGIERVLRGGCWTEFSIDCRSASRGANTPEYRHFGYGFRVVLVLPTTGL